MPHPFPRRAYTLIGMLFLAAISFTNAHAAAAKPDQASRCSPRTQGDLEVSFVNTSAQPVTFHWMDFDCAEGGGPAVAAGQRETGITHPGHVFRARGKSGQLLTTFIASENQRVFTVDDALIARVAAQGEPYTEGTCSPQSTGRFEAEFVNRLNEAITMQWIGFDCEVHVLRQIPAHGSTREQTFPGHVFRFVDASGRQLRSLDVTEGEPSYQISDD